MLMRILEEAAQALGGLLESVGELALLLIAPVLFERAHLRMQAGDESLQLVVEAIQIARKSPQLGRIDIGFAHERILDLPIAICD